MPGTGSAHAHDDPSLLGGRTDGREGVVVRMSWGGREGRAGALSASPRSPHLPRSSSENTIQLLLPVSCCCCLPSNLDKRCSCTHGPGHGPKWMEASACHACRSISLEHLALLYCILLLFIHGVVCILRRIYHRKEFENAEQ